MTKRRIQRKERPTKPYPDFPLFAHSCGRWAKKVRGRIVYFAKWDDPDGALDQWLRDKDDLLAGRSPRQHLEGVTVDEVVQRFLAAKKMMVDAGELSTRSWDDYKNTARIVLQVFGRKAIAESLVPADFDRLRARLAKTRGPIAIGNHVGRVRAIFRYASPDQAGLMSSAARFGPNFRRPSKRVVRITRAAGPKKLFHVRELRALIYAADPQLQAMCFLAINCGLGNADCARLKWSHVDLRSGWLDYSRPKTGIERMAPLWPETIQALQRVELVTAKRRERVGEELAKHCFITKYGKRWMGDGATSPISASCRKVLDRLGIYRPGLSFYAIRHTLQTVGDGAKDPAALAHIMGHVDQSMAGHYRQEMDRDRLRAVADHVHRWLLPRPTTAVS